ncbi:MAG: hypothetical protein SNH13_05140 [Rikenellaceae bacterium]
MKKCASCGVENELESKFCENCCSTEFVEAPASTLPGGLNIGDANAIDANDLVGHKEVIQGKKEQIMGNKEEINAQNYTVNQTIVQQTNVQDSELVELEKQKHRIEMEKMRYEAELAKLQTESARQQGAIQQKGAAEAKSLADDNAREVAALRAALQQNEVAMVQILGAMAEQEEQLQEQLAQQSEQEKQQKKEQEVKAMIDSMESVVYDMERNAQFSLSAEIGQRQQIIWASLSISLFIIAAATAIPFFWILLVVCIVLLVRSIVRKVKLGSANSNTLKMEDYEREYNNIRRKLSDSNFDTSRYSSTIVDFDGRLKRAKELYESEVKGAGSKAMIYVAVISAAAIILALVVAYSVVSSL